MSLEEDLQLERLRYEDNNPQEHGIQEPPEIVNQEHNERDEDDVQNTQLSDKESEQRFLLWYEDVCAERIAMLEAEAEYKRQIDDYKSTENEYKKRIKEMKENTKKVVKEMESAQTELHVLRSKYEPKSDSEPFADPYDVVLKERARLLDAEKDNKSTITSLKEEVKSLRDVLKGSASTENEYKRKIRAMEENTTKIMKDFESAQTELHVFRSKYQPKSDSELYAEPYDIVSKERARLLDAEKNYKSKITSLEAEVKSLSDGLKGGVPTENEYKKTIKEMEDKTSNVVKDLESAKTELHVLRSKYEPQNNSELYADPYDVVSKERTRLFDLEKKYKSTISSLEAEVKSLRDESKSGTISEYKNIIKEMEENRTQVVKELESAKTELHVLRSKYEPKSDSELYADPYDIVSKERARLLDAEKNYKSTITSMEAEVKLLRDELKSVTNSENDNKKRILDMEENTTKVVKELESAMTELHVLRSKYEPKSDSELHADPYDIVSKERARLLNAEKNYKSTITSLEAEVKSLRDELKRNVSSENENKKIIKEMEENTSKVVKELESAKTELHVFRSKYEPKSDSELYADPYDIVSKDRARLLDLEKSNKSTIFSLESEVQSLKDELKRSVCSENENKKIIKEMEENTTKVVKELESAKTELHVIRSKYEPKSELYADPYDIVTKERARLLDAEKNYKSTITSLEAEVKSLRDVLKSSEKENKKIIKEMEENTTKVVKELESAKTELHKLRSKYEPKSDSELYADPYEIVSKDRARLLDLEKNNKSTISSLEAEVKSLRDELKNGVSTENKYKKRIKKMEENTTKMMKELESAQTDLHKLRSKYEPKSDSKTYADPYDIVSKERARLLDAERNYKSTITSLKAKVKSLRDELKGGASTENENKQRIKEIEENTKKMMKELESAQTELHQLRSKYEFKSNSELVTGQYNIVSKERDRLLEAGKNYETIITSLKEEVRMLRDELKGVPNEVKHKKKDAGLDVITSTQRMEMLELENGMLKYQLEKLENERSAKFETLESLSVSRKRKQNLPRDKIVINKQSLPTFLPRIQTGSSVCSFSESRSRATLLSSTNRSVQKHSDHSTVDNNSIVHNNKKFSQFPNSTQQASSLAYERYNSVSKYLI